MHRDFREAVKEGLDTIRLRYLLSQGANLDSIDTLGLTALYYASFRGDVENVRLLLVRGANVNIKHYNFGTPIAIAALRRHPEVVKLLLQHKARVLSEVAFGSAMHCACFGGNVDIFTAIMLNDPSNDYLSLHRVVKLKKFSMLSAADLRPSGLCRLVTNEGPAIRCSPIFLAAERCRFDILSRSWSDWHFEYFSLEFWNFSDEEEKAERRETARRRIMSSYSSVESRSGPSYVSKASTSSAWSTLGFPLAPSEPYQSTLLMWAAASLNLPLIKHLLEAGAYVLTPDRAGRNALHYAATPFADATFKDVRACVELLWADTALIPTAPSIQIGQEPAPQSSLMPPLNLVVSADHEALDPRIGYKWGRDIHQNFISAFLDPLPTEGLKAQLARDALPHALSHAACPLGSIQLLCKHAVKPCHDPHVPSVSRCMNKSLHKALQLSAAEPVISILLHHGANANAARPQHPLITAIDHKAFAAVVEMLLMHGADPYSKDHIDTPMTPNQYAREASREDLLLLFKEWNPASRLAKLTPTHSFDPPATESLQCDHRDHSPHDMPIATDDLVNALNRLTESDDDDGLDEQDYLDETLGNKLGANILNARKDSAGSAGRSWLSTFSEFSFLRKNSKPK